MKKTLIFDIPIQRQTGGGSYAWLFPFSLVDSDYINTPEEASKTTAHSVYVSISDRLAYVWGFTLLSDTNTQSNHRTNLIKVLFEFGKRCIIQKLQQTGQIERDEEHTMLLSHDYPNGCPYSPTQIQNPNGAIVEVEVDNNPTRKRLRQEMSKVLDLNDFRLLCSDLSISFDNLAGDRLDIKISDLISHCDKYGITSKLKSWLVDDRPNTQWDEFFRQ